ncbi:hypothetical protein JCM19238_998 [Vibrio ponticus]|nr:hypothetical protein JCM19238_998 [Vibrio ponticus]
MKHIIYLLLFSLLSAPALAKKDKGSDDFLACEVNFNEDFSIIVDYGKGKYSGYESEEYMATTGWNNYKSPEYDDDELYLNDKNHNNNNSNQNQHSTVVLWSDENDDDDGNQALFYDEDIENVTFRFDYTYDGKLAGNNYQGTFTYYVNQGNGWIPRSNPITITTHFTAHKALVTVEVDDDDRDDFDEDLNNLRCVNNSIPEPEFKLDICPYVPGVAQTTWLIDGNHDGVLEPRGSMAISTAHAPNQNRVILPSDDTKLFLDTITVGPNCQNSTGQLVSCNLTDDLPYPEFPPQLGVFPDTSTAQSLSCANAQDCQNIDDGIYEELTIEAGQTAILTGGHYFFNKINLHANSKLLVESDTQIEYQDINFLGSNIKINNTDTEPSYDDSSDKLLFIGHGANSGFYVAQDNVIVHAYIFIEYVANQSNNGFGLRAYNSKLLVA